MSDYSELKRLSEAATQGPWIAAGPSFGSDSPRYCEEVLVDRDEDEDDTYTVCEAPAGLRSESTSDMVFIAAANPAAVLALITEVEALRKDAERYRWIMENLDVRSDGDYLDGDADVDADVDAAMTKGDQP